MQVPVWVHQVSTSYAASALPSDDSLSPFSAVWGKVFDGLNFMSTWDGHPAAIDGLAAVAARERRHEADGGREWKPWGVVRGAQPGQSRARQLAYARSEGELAAAVAAAGAGPGETRVIILDVEPYYHGGATPQFWRSDLGAGADHVAALLDRFLERGGEEAWLSIDARDPHLDPIHFDAWWAHPAVARVLPQTYWTDFRRPWRTSIDAANALLRGRGVPRASIAHVLPGDAEPADLGAAMGYLATDGYGRVSVWQRLSLTAAGAAHIAAMDDPWEAARLDVAAAVAALTRAKADVSAARSRLVAAEQRLESAEALLA